MLLESKHLVESIDDVFAGVSTYFRTVLADEVVPGNVSIAYGDAVDPESRTFPFVTIQVLTIAVNPAQRYGGFYSFVHDKDIDEESPTYGQATETKAPIPVVIGLQVDTFADDPKSEWAIAFEMTQRFGASETKITTPLGKEFFLSRQVYENLDSITEENLWRKAYRFGLETWFPHPDAAQTAYLVLKRRFDMNGAQFRPDE